jgi:hypothetical protein
MNESVEFIHYPESTLFQAVVNAYRVIDPDFSLDLYPTGRQRIIENTLIGEATNLRGILDNMVEQGNLVVIYSPEYVRRSAPHQATYTPEADETPIETNIIRQKPNESIDSFLLQDPVVELIHRGGRIGFTDGLNQNGQDVYRIYTLEAKEITPVFVDDSPTITEILYHWLKLFGITR